MAHYHQVWSPKSHTVAAPIAHWAEPIWKWLCAHLPHLRMIGISVAIVAILFGIMRGYTHFRESAALQLFDQFAATDAVPPKSVLETVSAKYPRTAIGKYADFLLATQYYQESRFDEAGKLYARLAEHNPESRLYHLIAADGEGYSEELQGHYAKAVEIFNRLAKIKDNPFAEQATQNAARNQKLAAGLAP